MFNKASSKASDIVFKYYNSQVKGVEVLIFVAFDVLQGDRGVESSKMCDVIVDTLLNNLMIIQEN